jgi:hypothetical protein
MADESYGSVGTPRIYVDYVQYLKAVGLIESFYAADRFEGDFNPADIWDLNPSKISTLTVSQGGALKYLGLTARFSYYSEIEKPKQVQYLLSTMNYGGILGHNFGNFGASGTTRNTHFKTNQIVNEAISNSSSANANYFDGYTDVIGFRTGRDLGCTLYTTSRWSAREDIGEESTIVLDGFQYDYADKMTLIFSSYIGYPATDATGGFFEGEQLKIGTATAGRYFDLPHSANLSLNQTISYDGVQSKRTIGGSDLTQVNYLRPKWGDLAPWTNVDLNQSPTPTPLDNDFSTAGFQGRRSWDLSFSYISKEDMFPRSYSNNTAGYYDYDDTLAFDDGDNSTGLYTDNVVNNWLNLTLSGQISHILQPDKDKPTDFAIVKMDKNSLQITQQAPMLYQFKVKLVEQF